MMNGMGTGTGSTIVAGYPLADWATGLVLLLLAILIVALMAGFMRAAVDLINRAVGKDTSKQGGRSFEEGGE